MAILGGRAVRLLAATIGLAAFLPGRAATELELQVKAAFLHNFTKFVDWPATAAQRTEFCIGLIGPDPFGHTIDQMVKGRTMNGKPIVIRRITRIQDSQFCQLLFMNVEGKERLAEMLKGVSGGVLTVGQADGFLEAGGMINFVIEDNRVRFEVNVEAAKKSGLRIHSQLLKLARNGR